MKIKVGQRLLAVREALGFERNDVAGETGLAINTLSNIERGLVNQSLHTVVKLCESYDVSIDSIVFDMDERFEELLNDLRGVMICAM